jgi:hypothetical protein
MTSGILYNSLSAWFLLTLHTPHPVTGPYIILKMFLSHVKKTKQGKAIPLTGCEGPWGCETSKLPHFLDNRFTDGSEVVSPMRWPPFTPQEDSWYSFPLEAESTSGP